MNRREIIKQGGLAFAMLSLPLQSLTKLKSNKVDESNSYDVIIIGGSYSGLSSALALGRSLRKVLIIDSGVPCNRQAPHSHNFITQDGIKPQDITSIAVNQVLKYKTVKHISDLVSNAQKGEHDFIIKTKTGKEFSSKKLIIATGIKDIMPDIKGFSACWGISIIHCPYCHGYEFHHKKTGIMLNAEKAYHFSPLIRNLSEDVTILSTEKANFNSEEQEILKKNKIKIIEKEIVEFQHINGNINQIMFKDGSKSNFDVVYSSVPFVQHSDIPSLLGCEMNNLGHIKVDNFQKTSVKGVFSCGDNSSTMRSIASAVFTGGICGSAVDKELAEEEFMR